MTDKVVHITPRGVAKWPWLRKQDTRFVKDDQVSKFKMSLDLDSASKETEDLIGIIQEFANSVKRGDGRMPWTEEDGVMRFKFASAYRPTLFDAKRRPMPDEVDIGSGSEVKVAFQMSDYKPSGIAKKGGVNLYLKAVQVLTYVPYTGPDAESLGFGEEEGFAPGADSFPQDGDEEKMPF